jgi:hypothetical protein
VIGILFILLFGVHALAVTMQSGGKWLRCRFLRKARSEACAYPSWICKRRTTKPLRKKIEQTRPIRLHGYGFSVLRSSLKAGHHAITPPFTPIAPWHYPPIHQSNSRPPVSRGVLSNLPIKTHNLPRFAVRFLFAFPAIPSKNV